MRRHTAYEAEDDINEFYTELIKKERPRRKNIFRAFKTQPTSHATRFQRYNTTENQVPPQSRRSHPTAYQRSVLGLTEFPTEPPRKNSRRTRYHTIAIQFPAFSLSGLKKLPAPSRRAWLVLAGAGLVIVAFVAGQRLISRREQPTTNITNVAPQSVVVPKKLPDGFSVGSSSQSLQNGAVIYIVYDDKGNEVTISQQALPENMDTSLFAGSQAFETRLGKAYIIETVDRITGYILGSDTMILFNSIDAISNISLRQLMEAYQP